MEVPMPRTVSVAGKEYGGQLFLIAGPCIAESEALCVEVAEKTAKLCGNLNIDYIFKASFDKANRSSISSERGPGLQKGLEMLAAVKEKAGVSVLSDIHEPGQAIEAAKVLDVLQIPAFLCRQTDLLKAAAQTEKPVNVKKGQFMAPWDMQNVVDKLRRFGASGIVLTERGSSFGYNRLVTDMTSIPLMQRLKDNEGRNYPVVIDATHSVQMPGGLGVKSGGASKFIKHIALAGLAAGADGLFLEVHTEPDKAPCDADNMLPLSSLEKLLKKALAVYKAVREQ
jgi:2-dehydro-3-deoxyphosphooctonate aldolase (KDO 8-P synthase)